MGEEQPNVSLGQRWKLKGEAGYLSWKVVSYKEGLVGISGPGPARSYRSLPVDEFIKTYEKLYDAKP